MSVLLSRNTVFLLGVEELKEGPRGNSKKEGIQSGGNKKSMERKRLEGRITSSLMIVCDVEVECRHESTRVDGPVIIFPEQECPTTLVP